MSVAGASQPGDVDVREPDESANASDPAAVAKYVCALASNYGIECSVVSRSGKHDFTSAVAMFESALPWLAGKLDTPGAPVVPLPGAPPS